MSTIMTSWVEGGVHACSQHHAAMGPARHGLQMLCNLQEPAFLATFIAHGCDMLPGPVHNIASAEDQAAPSTCTVRKAPSSRSHGAACPWTPSLHGTPFVTVGWWWGMTLLGDKCAWACHTADATSLGNVVWS